MMLSEGNLVVLIFAHVTETTGRLLVGQFHTSPAERSLGSAVKHGCMDPMFKSISISNENYHQNNFQYKSTAAMLLLLLPHYHPNYRQRKATIIQLRNMVFGHHVCRQARRNQMTLNEGRQIYRIYQGC
jgi:hypothetical protein